MKIDTTVDSEERNTLIGLVEEGIIPKQIFYIKKHLLETKELQENVNIYLKVKKLFMFTLVIPIYDKIDKKYINQL